jgi:hypothetical protein
METKAIKKSKLTDHLNCSLGITSELISGACYLYSNIFRDLRKVSKINNVNNIRVHKYL